MFKPYTSIMSTYKPSNTTLIPKKEKLSFTQKRAAFLFKKANIDYIPVENVVSITFGYKTTLYVYGVYYIHLRSNGLLILKLPL